jgi:hypothetical protein
MCLVQQILMIITVRPTSECHTTVYNYDIADDNNNKLYLKKLVCKVWHLNLSQLHELFGNDQDQQANPWCNQNEN